MKIIKIILAIISVLLLFLLTFSSLELMKLNQAAKVYKMDYAELHSVKYGMFNSDAWTVKITKSIEKKIEEFNITMDNRAEIEGYVSTVIDTLIVETQHIIQERNKVGTGFFESILGSTKQIITDSIIDFKELRKRVPEFTANVMTEIEKPENQERAKAVLRKKLKEFISNKFEVTTDMSQYNAILQKYDTKDIKTCTLILDKHLQSKAYMMHNSLLKILLITFIIIILVIYQGTLNSLGLLTLSGTTLTLLISGITLPMLDIEAKISKLIFIILENPIIFENQILFFKSKSIFDLFKLLIQSEEAKMILVGVLLVTFSIIFPLLKLLFTTLYYYSLGAISNNPITRFFALYSTKWSMADVMVVSIFMAYLGLDGVVDSELTKLEAQSNPINVITSNGTHLEVGFFLFLAFVLTSFVLSILVKNRRENTKEQETPKGNQLET